MPHLITGRAKFDHVTSGNDGLIHARMHGYGRYALHDVSCDMTTANSALVKGGLLLFDGRFVEVNGSGENVAIANGSQGMKRKDLIGVRYAIDSDGYESASIEAIKGVPSEGEPDDPAYDKAASILLGDSDVFWPLFRLRLDGLSVGKPEPIYETTAGEVVIRRDDVSPAAIYGGTWAKDATHLFAGLRIWQRKR